MFSKFFKEKLPKLNAYIKDMAHNSYSTSFFNTCMTFLSIFFIITSQITYN